MKVTALFFSRCVFREGRQQVGQSGGLAQGGEHRPKPKRLLSGAGDLEMSKCATPVAIGLAVAPLHVARVVKNLDSSVEIGLGDLRQAFTRTVETALGEEHTVHDRVFGEVA